MNWVYYLITALSVALSLICLYAAASANKKLNRLRKRYDYLLHGHGDINMEELIVQMHTELDQLKTNGQRADRTLNELSRWIGGEEGEENLFEERLAAINQDVQGQIHDLKDRVASSMKRLDEQVYAQMDATESEMASFTKQNIQDMHNQVDTFQSQLTLRIKKMEEDSYAQMEALSNGMEDKDRELSQLVKDMVTQMDAELHSTEKQMQQDMTALDHNLTTLTQNSRDEVMKRIQDSEIHYQETLTATQQSVQDELTSTTSQLNAQMKSFSENLSYHLSYALQRVALYRYNAFAGLSGEQSFSAALLNERGDGFIITSIYSRQGSSTFAKLIENKKPLQDLSPEESIALKKALNNKE